MPTSLILPVAADKEEYKGEMPYLFRLDRKGIMICLAAIKGLELDKFDGLYITILKKHNDIYKLEDLLDLQFRRLGIADKAHVVELETPTKSQPETVYMTIKKCAIKDGVFVKDADSYFETEMSVENSVCIYPLDYLNRVNPQNKSYVNVDDMYYITNIIEKGYSDGTSVQADISLKMQMISALYTRTCRTMLLYICRISYMRHY